MSILTRTKEGKLQISCLDLEIMLGDLFASCKTEKELDFVRDNLEGATEKIYDERLDEIERGIE